jgi:putative ABC transport system substrate-binding protein
LSPASAADGLPNLEALRAGLRGIGYVEGKNITFEVRWADGRSNRLPQLAAELVRLPVDVLCTAGSQATGAAKQATSTIPIVFANVAFPDKSGIVASYPRPGANITGVAFIGPEYGKRLELLREALPQLSRVALIYNPENVGSVLALQETQRWAAGLSVTLEPHMFRGPDDFEIVFSAIAAKRPDALMTSVQSGHSVRIGCSMTAARENGDGAATIEAAPTGRGGLRASRRSDLRGYLSDQPQDRNAPGVTIQ